MTPIQQSILGCIIYDAKAMPRVIRYGVTDDWFTDDGRTIYKACLSAYATSGCIDFTQLLRRLPDHAKTLHRAIDLHTTAHLQYYLEGLEHEYLLEKAKILTAEQNEILTNTDADHIAENLEQIRQEWMRIGLQRKEEQTLYEIGKEQLVEWQKPDDPSVKNIVWPLDSLNKSIGYLSDELIFLCALESVGKTALALQILLWNAQRGTKVAMASMESKRKRITPRLMSLLSHINSWKLSHKQAMRSDYEKAGNAWEAMKTLPISITECGMTMDQVKAWGQCEKANGASLLIVDNMRHIRPTKHFLKPVEHFRDLSVNLKWMRDDLDLPMIVLHHLNEKEDVSWSKDIKRDADILMYMTDNEDLSIPPSVNTVFSGTWAIDVELRKVRDGEAGFTMTYKFDKPIQTFKEWAQGVG